MSHAVKAYQFNKDEKRVTWHDESLWQVRKSRDNAVKQIPEWEKLRETASKIKANVMSHLDDYLLEFEKNATSNGIKVHWAVDADEHNQIAYKILKDHKATRFVKSKSMLTEECGLNRFLEAKGIEVIDTDLGERIIQLANEKPSHIVLPAIHKKREEIDLLFHEKLGTELSGGDAQYLTEAARQHLREKFLGSHAALTGVNFAVAETGGFVVCTNEGNADMGVHLAPLHIASMGIEKLIPRAADLGVFLRLLARSATGQAITVYSTHHLKPRKGTEMHIILVDNGRSAHLGKTAFRESLHCIRCGACMNTCPVYRRSGGHSYGTVVPGPIGSILSPGIDLKKNSSLPFASTLCGACTNVCPVKIDIHRQLYLWRQIIMKKHGASFKRRAMHFIQTILSNSDKYQRIVKMVRFLIRILPRFVVYNRLNVWGRKRELPASPRQSFTEWYQQKHHEK